MILGTFAGPFKGVIRGYIGIYGNYVGVYKTQIMGF